MVFPSTHVAQQNMTGVTIKADMDGNSGGSFSIYFSFFPLYLVLGKGIMLTALFIYGLSFRYSE